MRRTVLLAVLIVLSAHTAALADEWDDAKKKFRAAVKSEEAKARAAAYTDVSFVDRAETVGEILSGLSKESNALVVVAAIRALGRLDSAGAREAFVAAIRSQKGNLRLWLLVAASEKFGAEGSDVLVEVVQGKDAPAAAQAALALGKRQVTAAVPHLKALLQSDDWHLRSAGARAIGQLGGVDPKEVLPALADALALAQGRDRADLVTALEKVSGQTYGYDLTAWKSLAAGTPPAQITAKPTRPPYYAGLPLYGRRVVLLLDNGVRTDDPHPFAARDRLQALCQVPDARPVPWYELRTVRQFLSAHATRVVGDLPETATFDVISVGLKPRSAFGKLAPANSGTKKVATDFIVGLKGETQHDDLGALTTALDVSGKKDSVAWSLGPDEILYATSQGPWLAPVTDPGEVGATVGLTARLRMVPVHTVGIGDHPGEMLRTMSTLSGGTYLDLSR